MTIETKNLLLIPCETEILKSAIQGNEILAKKINVTVQDNWTEFGVGPLQYSLDRLTESEEEKNWLTYFPIYKQDNKLIGSGGYKGKPTIDGIVELGYEIAPKYRNRGLATEMTKGLIENAFKDERVKTVIAHTLRQENPAQPKFPTGHFHIAYIQQSPRDLTEKYFKSNRTVYDELVKLIKTVQERITLGINNLNDLF